MLACLIAFCLVRVEGSKDLPHFTLGSLEALQEHQDETYMSGTVWLPNGFVLLINILKRLIMLLFKQ